MATFKMSSKERTSQTWQKSFTDSPVNHYETSSNGDEDEIPDQDNKAEDEARCKKQTSETETSDEDDEIENEKSVRKLERLHAGIGHCLGQINMNESNSISQQKTETIQTDGKESEKSKQVKCYNSKDETTSIIMCHKAQDLPETNSLVSKISSAFTNMWSWLFHNNYKPHEFISNQKCQNTSFKSKMSIKTKKSARLHSHPYKTTARHFHVPLGPTILSPSLPRSGLRPIVIDGFNVAMSHGRALAKGGRTKFSGRGIEMCVEFFKLRGHENIVAFLPQHAMALDRDLLGQMEKEGVVVFTPSRKVGGRRITSYDDRFIVEFAHHHAGVIVTRDHFADLYEENPEWRKTIEEMVLVPTFVGDTLMFPADPQGKEGPTLDQLLRN